MSSPETVSKPIRVAHVIVGLNAGGAELMLERLICHEKLTSSTDHSVISLTTVGAVGESLRNAGIKVDALGIRSFADAPRAAFRLWKIFRDPTPDVVQTWMYHSDFLGGLAAKLAGVKVILWGIRCSPMPFAKHPVTSALSRVCAALSYVIPTKILCCAQEVKTQHAKLGYSGRKLVTIPNGYNFVSIDEDSRARLRERFRKQHSFEPNHFVVGMVARFAAQKDHESLIRAAVVLLQKRDDFRFILAGTGIDDSNEELTRLLSRYNVSHAFTLLGQQKDLSPLYAGVDITCLSSAFGEGFPNVLCESMHMQTICVATDVGDSAKIIDVHGHVVPPRSPEKLAEAIEGASQLTIPERLEAGLGAAHSVRQRFGIAAAAARFQHYYLLSHGSTHIHRRAE
jgi:glycosyltransferase involved in cell wall biosynthesis